MSLSDALAARRLRRERKRALADAQHLVGEARRILRKKAYRIPETVAKEVEAAVAEVEAAFGGDDLEAQRTALTALDERMEKHLAFARKSAAREYAESIGVAVAVALFLRAFVVEAFQIPSGSMIPTLEVGDHIFVSKFSYGVTLPFSDRRLVRFGQPRRGDVIVFRYPKDPGTDYIKRVVAVPGDRVEVRQNELWINGAPASRQHVDEPCSYSESPRYDGYLPERPCDKWIETLDGNTHTVIHSPGLPRDYPPVTIPEGEVFVMGDNRDNSNDSRVWGTVPLDLIKGKALIVWWSRGPTRGEVSPRGFVEWLQAVRWRRFFHVVN